ncbi:MAG TPA: tetratricopeptide repeat protein [Pyrinomonadaceae bacterium]|jgi:tetratricopeptide (TPR) repeat protein|nr:tetratricopeptide repeat protein [Pyrinomonadaceae bacterium]
MSRSIFYFVVIVIFSAQFGCSGSSNQAANNSEANSTSFAAAFTDANAALRAGSDLLESGETEKAIEVLNRAVELDPDLAEAYFKLGIAYALIEKRDEIAETEANTAEPDAEKPKKKKSNSEIAFEKAVTAYKKLIATNPEDHLAFFNLGRSYNKLNEDEKAEAALEQAVKLNPEDTEYQTELGAIRIKLANYQAAIGPLKKALELDPDNIKAQELLEDAEAGRSRISFTTVKKDDKNANKNANVSNSNTAAGPANTQSQAPDRKEDKPKPPTPKP